MTDNPLHLRIGTRGSELALWQARHVGALLAGRGVRSELIIIKTRGDKDPQAVFQKMGGKGIFTKEIEDALLAGEIDLAIHSLKDLPTSLPEGLQLAAVPKREDPRDGWICPQGCNLEDLPAGSRVATGSLRRAAQVLARRPDLECVPFRGNVPTRLRKLQEGEGDATLLAMAGLRRLNMAQVVNCPLPVDVMTPAMGQGALGIETRAGDHPELWAALEDAETRTAVNAERAFVHAIGGGCRTPAGVLAEPRTKGWLLTAMLASADGSDLIREHRMISKTADLEAEARQLAAIMLKSAPESILELLEPTIDVDANPV